MGSLCLCLDLHSLIILINHKGCNVNMSVGKVAMVGGGGRVTVPRKYFRAAVRGLQHVPWWCQSDARTSATGKHPLDEALKCAATFQSRSLKQWEDALSVSSPYRSTDHLAAGKAVVTAPGTTITLQSLADYDGGEAEDQEESHEVSAAFVEKQQAKLHAMLQQWVAYCAFHCTRAEFAARQSLVAQRLLLSPLGVLPSSAHHQVGSARLERTLRRRGARAYVDLLVHHQLPMQQKQEWDVLCSVWSSVGEGLRRQGLTASSAASVVRLPFTQEAVDEPSWERSLAVLSWAMHFKGGNQFHIPSSDIAIVLHQYIQSLEDRVQGPNPQQMPVTEEQAVIQQLQQWWNSAREAEQRDAGLAAACGLDRTAFNSIHVEGRKVTLCLSDKELSKSTAAYAELLLQGRWEDVLEHIRLVATNVASGPFSRDRGADRRQGDDLSNQRAAAAGDCDDDEGKEEIALITDGGFGDVFFSIGSNVTSCGSSTTDALVALFNTPRPVFLKSKVWARSSSSPLGKPPREYLLALETPLETVLLQKPPVVGLRTRAFATRSDGGTSGIGLMGKVSCSDCSDKQLQESGECLRATSAALVELRRKLWILRQLPRHLSRSLVRFEGAGSFMVPYLLRCPAKELLPWFLLSKVASAHSRHQNQEKLEEAFRDTRLHVLYTLFLPHAHYAAFQEYCADLLLQVGSLIVPLDVLRVAVRVLLQPPSFDHFYDVLQGRRLPVEVDCRHLWSRSVESSHVERESDCSTSLTPSCLSLLKELQGDAAKRQAFFVCKSHSARNYHLSTWIESCSKVETLSGLIGIIAREVNLYGPPLLSPEAAAALLTAIVIPHIGERGGAKYEGCEQASEIGNDTLRMLGVAYFVLPSDKAFGAAPYFKGTYNEKYIIDDGFEWTTDWDGAEALLVGRSLRRVTKYPTTTTESFFRVECCSTQQMVTYRVPKLRLRLMKVDLVEAIQYFECGVKRITQDEGANDKICGETVVGAVGRPAVVAYHLPFGVAAVDKPAGMSTTLHVGHPHLLDFLAGNLPWKGPSAPVLFQHGLVNRIDLGTSGLVLVADTEASLEEARRASIVERCVEKVYRALVLHCPPPISRIDTSECWYLNPCGIIMCDVLANGADFSLQIAAYNSSKGGALPVGAMDRRSATTTYRVLQYFPRSGVYYLEIHLHTGRRHQIRQHFARLCHPLLGDGRYSRRAQVVGEEFGLQRPALHAVRVTLTPQHGTSAKPRGGVVAPRVGDADYDEYCGNGGGKTVVECPVPEDMRLTLKMLREREDPVGLGA
ncbi:RNA pseudouridylate synthase protein, putative [Trypanosoma brucei brucei TREU927]|uniref:RNA pseudouridylate synthase protein, putative n=1 Tax=Trypanosoma brucei brucei (strain 927/4 GUTat10.1) TaxID=185431 RepID=Q38EM9_TRYB2|nr:RNA pseudouridylate synthase protein, putative [Trypanosoma brucei brucei TREU927]EAN76741.1 RNA pseudouridylate synthase protein, putative [Trypanosoma brucei brucei TREU927]